MITHDLIQGSPEWLAYRAQHFNASDAPAMMGCSPYKTRAKLLHEMHTGVAAEVDVATQKRFDNGHRAEALARPLAEEFIGQELYPVTGSAEVGILTRALSASFDGLTLDESEAFEHKALNQTLRECMEGEDESNRLPIYHRVQMEQQLLVSGARRILFMASEWTADGELVEERHCWYQSDPLLRQQIVDGWAQFERDLAAYTPPEKVEPVTAAPMESLPAVSVRMDGALAVQSNLPAFGAALRAFVERIPKQPTTDQEFADTEAACKALKKAEEALDQAEQNALASMADVEAMRRLVADFRTLARDTRLERQKMVERRKQELREQAVEKARRALDQHVAELNAEIAPMRLQPVHADFAGAIKGLRSIASMQDALDTTLAAAKIAADTQARGIRENVHTFKIEADTFEFLFADLAQLVHKPRDDFRTLVQARINNHKSAEAERERKRAEEEQRRIAEAEQRAREEAAAAERKRIEDEERARQQEVARQAAIAATPAPTPAPAACVQHPTPERDPMPTLPSLRGMATLPPSKTSEDVVQASREQWANEPATLKLGDICARLGFTVSAAFLADCLRVTPAKVEGASKLYTETQFQTICRQLLAHVSAVAEVHAGEVVA